MLQYGFNGLSRIQEISCNLDTKPKTNEKTPIKTEKDYTKALNRLELIFDASPDSKEGVEAEISSLLIENYENIHYPIDAPK